MTSHTMIFILFLLSVSVTFISGGTHGDFKRLHQVLTTDYNKDLRPTLNSSEPTNIKVRFFLLSLNEFEEKMSKLSIVGAFALSWNDFQLEWNPGDYGNITRMFFPQSSVWKPDLLLINPYQKISPLGFSDMKLYVIHNGHVFWSPPDVFEVTCQADVTFYPFDEQTCSLYFGVYMHTELEVVLDLPARGINLRHYTTNSLWDLKHTSMTQRDPSSLKLILVLQRRSMYQVINTILPFCVLGLLNIMVFLLPAESGERIGFSVTILLAIAVFMTIVADTLPGTSEPSFPRLCYLLTAELVINMLVTVLTILVLRLHHKPEHQTIPAWMEYVKTKLLCGYKKGDSK
ncbi:neuronal acetylcholine receptor subunit alpha-7-like [Argopecten irradians]|uniref:neuronal acetylcholine receptor subunit alpha-7-like n=1 Tax=Argopecten irradians TaxID=31199 RepID=UPI0037107065